MRRSREDTTATRLQIVEAAARLFRERGINGIGLADLMGEVGLTHGGFYKHFPSKDALAGEACAAALAQTRSELESRAGAARDEQAFKTAVSSYLGQAHRDHPEEGCAIAALGSELARGDGPPRAALVEGVDALLQTLRRQMARSGVDEKRLPAHAALAAMVGGLLLARVVEDPAKVRAILRDTQALILKAA
jgi:TetR/AcrR family transcriptional repressor of nem operon